MSWITPLSAPLTVDFPTVDPEEWVDDEDDD
jgi:hypothetical protein